MKIPRELPQFDDNKALFIVMGKRVAQFYRAHKQELSELTNFKIEKPKYSDREGFFMSRGKGRIFGAGSVYETKNNKVVKDFLNRLEETGRKIIKEEGVTKIYFFAPEHILKEIKETMRKITPTKTELHSFIGNYTNAHPLDLIRELQGRKERNVEKRKVDIIKEEAKKILEKTRNFGRR